MNKKRVKNIIREETKKVLNEINMNSPGVLDVMSDDECMDIIRQLNMIASQNNI